MKSITSVSLELVELAEQLQDGDRLCAATDDESMRREYQEFAEQLACATESFRTKLSSILTSTPRLTPELREWALQQTSDAEILAGLKELREQGGTEFGEVIQRLKQKRRDRERARS